VAVCQEMHGGVGPTREENPSIIQYFDAVPFSLAAVEHCSRRIAFMVSVESAVEGIEGDVEPAFSSAVPRDSIWPAESLD